jgi:hypothetical protein
MRDNVLTSASVPLNTGISPARHVISEESKGKMLDVRFRAIKTV